MTRQNLIIVHQGGGHERDFTEIAEKINFIDPSITIYTCANGTTDQLPQSAWDIPTLTVSLAPQFLLPIRRGPILKCRKIDKWEQYNILRNHSIPTPPASQFRFGMKLDRIQFGSFVVLKSQDLEGFGIQVFRRELIEQLKTQNFSMDHPVLQAGSRFLVSRYIYTGEYASVCRILTLCGTSLSAMKIHSDEQSPSLKSDDELIYRGSYRAKYSAAGITFGELMEERQLAEKASIAFPDVPLLGVDIISDYKTQKLFVLEVTPVGAWIFSNPRWKKRFERNPRLLEKLKTQFDAFSLAAEVLVKKTNELAS